MSCVTLPSGLHGVQLSFQGVKGWSSSPWCGWCVRFCLVDQKTKSVLGESHSRATPQLILTIYRVKRLTSWPPTAFSTNNEGEQRGLEIFSQRQRSVRLHLPLFLFHPKGQNFRTAQGDSNQLHLVPRYRPAFWLIPLVKHLNITFSRNARFNLLINWPDSHNTHTYTAAHIHPKALALKQVLQKTKKQKKNTDTIQMKRTETEQRTGERARERER